MKKVFKISLISFSVLLLTAVLVLLSGYLTARFHAEKAVFPAEAELQAADGKFFVGGNVHAKFTASLPIDRKILKADFSAGKNSVSVGNAVFRTAKWKWSRRTVEFSVLFRPLQSGEIGESSFTVELSAPRGGAPEKFTVAVPEFTSIQDPDIVPESKLFLAPQAAVIAEKTTSFYYWAIAAAAVLIAIALWCFIKHKRTYASAETPSWDMALAALENVRQAVQKRELFPVTAFTALTDIVRNYLEIRFDLPASRRTTGEFLTELSNSPVFPEAHKPQLCEFLTSADLIKFAKADADVSAVESAVGHAEELVKATIPPPAEDGKN